MPCDMVCLSWTYEIIFTASKWAKSRFHKKKKKLVTKASSWIIYISKLTHPWKTSKSTMAIALLFGYFLDIFLPSLQHEVVLKGKRGPLYI